jgi:hypothetical protein
MGTLATSPTRICQAKAHRRPAAKSAVAIVVVVLVLISRVVARLQQATIIRQGF